MLRKKYDMEVIQAERFDDSRRTICNSRNILRDRVLKFKYDYLFMLETDVLPPKEILVEFIGSMSTHKFESNAPPKRLMFVLGTNDVIFS
jgi:hypothetical protein